MAKELSRDDLLELYRQMVLIRRFEEKSAELYAEGKIGGFLHLYIGEEAIAVGACKALRPTDHLFTAYRDHGWAIARGLDPKRVMAELLGKATGVSGGKGGSMHLASAEHRYWGGHAIVGGHLPLATGVGIEIRYNEKPEAVLCVLGEGTTNIGYFHESVNLAAVWKLPVVFLVENNQYGMGTEVGKASAVSDIYQKGCAYDIAAPPDRTARTSSRRTRSSAKRWTARARRPGAAGGVDLPLRRPLHGRPGALSHQGRDRGVARPRSDPPPGRQAAGARAGHAGRAGRRSTHAVEAEMAEIVQFAEESPEPEDAALCEHVFVNPIGTSVRGFAHDTHDSS